MNDEPRRESRADALLRAIEVAVNGLGKIISDKKYGTESERNIAYRALFSTCKRYLERVKIGENGNSGVFISFNPQDGAYTVVATMGLGTNTYVVTDTSCTVSRNSPIHPRNLEAQDKPRMLSAGGAHGLVKKIELID